MALSLESIYKPVSSFFLKRFETGQESPVFFKFDKIGSAISDEDYNHPDNPLKIVLKFSELVNQVLIEDSDGLNVIQSMNNIDDTYEVMINDSLPFAAADDPHMENIINNFAKTKADALRGGENVSLARPDGIMQQFKPSYSVPENWFDRNNYEIWAKHEFEAGETASTIEAPEGNDPKNQLWRLKADDFLLQQILPVKTAEAINPNLLHGRVMMLKANTKFTESSVAAPKVNPNVKLPGFVMVTPMMTASSAARISQPVTTGASPKPYVAAATRIWPASVVMPMSSVSAVKAAPPAGTVVKPMVRNSAVHVRDHRAIQPMTEVRDHRKAQPVNKSFHIFENLQKTIGSLNFKEKHDITRYIKENAPTQSVTTNRIKITFEFCKVDIQRPWLYMPFINSNAWYISGIKKGQLSLPGSGGGISVLPIAFIAIKNLNIEANWSELDIVNAKNATDFGPFEVSSEIVNNKLSKEGIQIIGWMLQRMPELPPNDPPRP